MKRVTILLLAIMLIISITLPVNAEKYTVKDGDVLWKIAREHDVSVEAIVEDNDIKNANRIYTGDTLTIHSNTDQDSRAVLNWTAEGFKQAESVLYVPNHEWLYTSNVNQEGVGYISRLSLDGEVDTYKFVDNVPVAVGMAYNDGYIYAASQTKIKVIDIKSGEIVKELVAAEGGMINDITFSPEGDLYATDFMTQRIYISDGEKLVTWLTSDIFMMLNGIYFDNDELLVSNMNMQDMTGSIVNVDVTTKEISHVKSMENIGAIDGITKLENHYLASNATTRELLAFTEETVEVLGVFEGGMADISVNQETGQVYLPYLETGEVRSYSFDITK